MNCSPLRPVLTDFNIFPLVAICLFAPLQLGLIGLLTNSRALALFDLRLRFLCAGFVFCVFPLRPRPVHVQQDPPGERHGRGVPGGVLPAVPVERSVEREGPARCGAMPPNRHR